MKYLLVSRYDGRVEEIKDGVDNYNMRSEVDEWKEDMIEVKGGDYKSWDNDEWILIEVEV